MYFTEPADDGRQINAFATGPDDVDAVGHLGAVRRDDEPGAAGEEGEGGVDVAAAGDDADSLPRCLGWPVALTSDGASTDEDDVGDCAEPVQDGHVVGARQFGALAADHSRPVDRADHAEADPRGPAVLVAASVKSLRVTVSNRCCCAVRKDTSDHVRIMPG
jgi:hypothetical protein